MAKYIVAALLGLACLTGCRMCACPYDNCSPVIENSFSAEESVPAADDDYNASAAPAGRAANQPHYAAGGLRLAPGQ